MTPTTEATTPAKTPTKKAGKRPRRALATGRTTPGAGVDGSDDAAATETATNDATGRSSVARLMQRIGDERTEDIQGGLAAELQQMFKVQRTAKDTWEALSTRSDARGKAAARFARTTCALSEEFTAEFWSGEANAASIDLAAAVTVTRLAQGGTGRRVSPATALNELGAFTALVSRIFPDAAIAWRRCDLARQAIGSTGGKGGGKKVSRADFSPQEVTAILRGLGEADALEERDAALAAAMALASAFSLPVSVTTHVMVDEIDVLADPHHQTAVILGYRPREGRKTFRRTCVPEDLRPQGDVKWMAAATPTLHEYFRPWWAHRKALDKKYLFDQNVTAADGTEDDDDDEDERPMQPAALQNWIKHVTGNKALTWHALRIGTARALQLAHTTKDGPSEPINQDIQNILQMRSNVALKGSKDAYDKPVLDALLAATRNLHAVNIVETGGLISTRPVYTIPAPHEACCEKCKRNIKKSSSGTYCDVAEVDCLEVICTKCCKLGKTWTCAKHKGRPTVVTID